MTKLLSSTHQNIYHTSLISAYDEMKMNEEGSREMGEYREIITKAVVAKGRKFTQSNHTISPAHSPTSILGCWIINHKYNAKKVGKTVEIHGSYDINVWYSFNDNTKTEVVTERVQYTDVIKLKYRDHDCLDDNEIMCSSAATAKLL